MLVMPRKAHWLITARAVSAFSLCAALPAARPPAIAAQVDVAMVQVVPDTVVIRVGGRALLSVQPRDRDGSVLPGLRVTWRSRDTTVASVDAKGYVVGVGAGVTIVTARVEEREGIAIIVVRPRPPGASSLVVTSLAFAAPCVLPRFGVTGRSTRFASKTLRAEPSDRRMPA